MAGIKHEAYRARREIVQPVPDARYNQQSLIGAVERIGKLIGTVVDGYIKAAADGNNELDVTMMAVPAPLGPARHIIDVERALDVKRHFNTIAHRRQIAVSMVVLVERENAAVVDARLAVTALGGDVITFFHASML